MAYLISFLIFCIVPNNAFRTPAPAPASQSQLYQCHSNDEEASALETVRNETSPSCIASGDGDGSKTNPLELLPQLYTFQTPRQKRRPRTTLTRARKRRYYWHSLDNLREELSQFWDELGVPIQNINRDQPPPIPSEHLLNYFGRNDLRWAIAQMGGRENVSHLLDGAKIIPGRWKEAIELEEVKYLLPQIEGYDKQGLQKKENTTLKSRLMDTTQQSMHTHLQNGTNRSGNSTTLMSLVSASAPTKSTRRQGTEFWSKEKAIKELYQYLESYRKYKERPAVWMPQLAEISHEGYSELFNACSRFERLPCVSVFSSLQNQDEDIRSLAGLVSFREWRYFESQFQFFIELQHYLNLHHDGSEEFFPEPSVVLMHGHARLHELIRIHGGKTMLAQKLDMKFAWEVSGINTGDNQPSSISYKGEHSNSYLSWGSFKLDFAIELLHFIRSQYLSLDPPLSSSFISMPSEKDLLRSGHDDLAARVMRYGGYENVARRLGLAYFDGKGRQMEERRFRGSKLLWKGRHSVGVLSSKENSSRRKRQGLAWDENLVINELHAYVKVNMTKRSLPPTVMPRFRHLDEDERADLRRAISKFGGTKYIGNKAGLIQIEEWEKLDLNAI